MERFSESIVMLEQLIEIEETDDKTRSYCYYIRWKYFESKKYEQAAESHEKAIYLNLGHAKLFEKYAECLFRLKRYEESMDTCPRKKYIPYLFELSKKGDLGILIKTKLIK